MKKQTKKKKNQASTSAKKPAGNGEVVIDGNKRLMTVRHGPRKEKVQISVRLSKAYMDLAYAHIERTNTRITDLLERGLALAMAEEVKMPEITQHVRFLVANTTTEQQGVIRDVLVWLAIPEVSGCPLTVTDQYVRASILQGAGLAKQRFGPKCDEALRLYHRYGRSAEARGPVPLPPGE